MIFKKLDINVFLSSNAMPLNPYSFSEFVDLQENLIALNQNPEIPEIYMTVPENNLVRAPFDI